MKSRGRYHVQPLKIKNGFYIEVCNKGVKKGMKIRSENQQAMENAASLYAGYKEVIIIGEYKNGEPVISMPVSS